MELYLYHEAESVFLASLLKENTNRTETRNQVILGLHHGCKERTGLFNAEKQQPRDTGSRYRLQSEGIPEQSP